MESLNSRVERSLVPIVARWASQDKHLLLTLFPLLVSGNSLQGVRFAEELGLGADALSTALGNSLVEIDAQGRVAELFGITRQPTLHRIDVAGDTLYSCCALVAHMLPVIWQQPVLLESTDPIGGGTIRLAISADFELQSVEPTSARASLVDCKLEEIIASARSKFCCHVKHFTSCESAAEFSSHNPARYVMTIEEFHEAAKWLYRHIWREGPIPD